MEEQQEQQQDVPHYETPEAPKRRSRLRQMSSRAAKHVVRSAANGSRDFFYQTTLEERVIILASIASLVIAFLPWAVSTAGGTIVDVSGVASFLYLMGVLVIVSALTALWSIVWVLMEKPFPKFLDSPAKLHILLGLEIMQIGLIAYTMFQASFTLTQDLEGKTVTLIALVISGLAIMGAGIFELNKQRKRNTSKVMMPTQHEHHHDHAQSDAELENILGGEDRE